MIVRFKRSKRSLHQRLAIGQRWRHVRGGPGLKRYVRVVQSSWDSTINHSVWVAARAAFRDASSRSRAFRRRRARRSDGELLEAAHASASKEGDPGTESGFAPGERGTLEIGSGVVLGALGIGLQLGRWPVWTALVAVGGYLTWVVVYSEATVQTRRWRSGERRPLTVTPLPKTSASPAQE